MGVGIEIFGGEHQLRKPSEKALCLSFSPYEEDWWGLGQNFLRWPLLSG